jgi:hypothetical protein
VNQDARFDSLVRTALREELLAPTSAETRRAFDRVLHRSRRQPPRPSTWWVTAAAAAAVAAVVAVPVALWQRDASSPLSGPAVSAAPPAGLAGAWRRDVRATEDRSAEGTWIIRVRADGVLSISAPAGVAGTDGASYAATSRELRIDAFVNGDCGEAPAGRYRWSVTGSRLDLLARGEACAFRRAVFSGAWRRMGP